MADRPFKTKAIELRKAAHSAGFLISSMVDISIELLLERTREQQVVAGVQVVANNDSLPGFFAVTQDYLIFSKRSPRLFMSPLDVFEIKLKPDLRRLEYPRMSFASQLSHNTKFNGIAISDSYSRANAEAIYQISDFLVSGRRPNDPLPKVKPGLDGPPL